MLLIRSLERIHVVCQEMTDILFQRTATHGDRMLWKRAPLRSNQGLNDCRLRPPIRYVCGQCIVGAMIIVVNVLSVPWWYIYSDVSIRLLTTFEHHMQTDLFRNNINAMMLDHIYLYMPVCIAHLCIPNLALRLYVITFTRGSYISNISWTFTHLT